MNAEKQVVSLEIAKKVNGLGVKRESLFSWKCNDRTGYFALTYGIKPSDAEDTVDIPAYTVGELGEMLPERIQKRAGRGYDGLQIWKWGSDWNIEYHEVFDTPQVRILDNLKEADSRGKMLIYLIENKLVTLAQVNGEGL
jgi:hypothetical protein